MWDVRAYVVRHENMKNLSWKSQNVEKSKIEDLDMKEC